MLVIEKYGKRIETVDMQLIKDSHGKYQISEMIERCNLSIFNSPYRALDTLLKRFRHPLKSRTTIMFETPPQQQTVPANSSYTGGSEGSKKSGSSTESKPEPYAHEFVNEFLEATLTTVGRWMEGLPWVKSVARASLSRQSAFPFMH